MRKRWIVLLVVLALLIGVGYLGVKMWNSVHHALTPERCSIVNPKGEPVMLTPEQSRMASIIVAASYEAELPERAAVIALATAYQESGIRNLDYGDRDSLGLFQQRPDPRFDWGTAEEIMDPWYSSLRFYEELVKFDGWETRDINDQAQKVQRSGHPQAYRKHVPNATALAAAARGSRHEAIVCSTLQDLHPDPAPIAQVLDRIKGVNYTVEGNQIRITAESDQMLWSAAHLAQLNTYAAGVQSVQVKDRRWTLGDKRWSSAKPVEGAVVTLN